MSATTDIAETKPSAKRKAKAADRWDLILPDLDRIEVPQLSEYARRRRAEGVLADDFLHEALGAIEAARSSRELGDVFALSGADDWNMPSVAIYHARDLIEAGQDAAQAYSEAKARYFTFEAMLTACHEANAVYDATLSLDEHTPEGPDSDQAKAAVDLAREDFYEAFDAAISFPTNNPAHLKVKKAMLIARSYDLERALDLLIPECGPLPTPAGPWSGIEGPDAELMRLGADLEVRWAAEAALNDTTHSDEEFEAAVEHTGEIAHRIHAFAPTTLEGFRVSARAVAWHAGAFDRTIAEDHTAASSFSLQAARLIDALTAGTANDELAQGVADGWGELTASFQAVRSSLRVAIEAESRAQVAFEEHVEGLRPKVMKDAKVYFEAGLDQNARLTLAQKFDLLPHVRAWKEIRDKAWKDFDCEALVDVVNDLDTERTELEERILKQPPVGLGSIVAKLAVTLYRMSALDPENPTDLRRLLGDSDYDAHGELAGVFLEALRLADPGHPAAAVKAFDPAGWAAEFEAYPGHKVTVRGPEYQDPIAWGPDMPAYESILITDPEAIARFDARMRSNYTDAQWAKELARPGRYDRAGRAIVVDDQQRIDYAYPDGGPEADRLMALLALRGDQYFGRRSPLGAHLWRGLDAWEREAVRDHVKANPALFPEGRDWPAAEWVKAYEEMGGRIDVNAEGEVFVGSPYPVPSAQARLWSVLVNNGMEHSVAAYIDSRREGAQ